MSSGPARSETDRAGDGLRSQRVRAAQTRLLYENADTGLAVTLVAVPVLAAFQWSSIPHPVAAGWLLYMLLAAVARFILNRRYAGASPENAASGKWNRAFAVGSGLAAAGWASAGILLYPEARLVNQIFLVFVLSGVMVGGASLRAPRLEASLPFLLPTGLVPAARLLYDGDWEHLAMGVLTIVFTASALVTTVRFYRTIESSLNSRFQNHDLLSDLQAAKRQTEQLNEQLELRVEERTAELNQSAKQLRAEITQRILMEEELLRARNLESLGVLAGGIAHDFNNFLTIIQGNLEVLRMRLSPSEPLEEIFEQMSIACQRAALLSSRLLTFAKGGAPVRSVASIARLVADAVHLARAGAAVNITVDIASDLWSAEVDAGQIGQVLHNILLNAKQSMPEGGIIEVKAGNAQRDDEKSGARKFVRISIRDHGCGIPAKILSRIFDPYFTTRQSGSGLGLTTSYAIVTKHGGNLSVESEEGRGTMFTVDLPASQATLAKESPVVASSRGGRGKVLVMDDEELLLTIMSQALIRLGYKVQTAREGAEAISLFETAKSAGRGFDAVLLDLTVGGGMGGLETASWIKGMDPGVKLIVSSGYSDAPIMSAFQEHGFDYALPKPWTVAQLAEAFRAVFSTAAS